MLKNVSDAIHADSLTLFALNIEILLADVTMPEMSNILTLTWPVTSLVTCDVTGRGLTITEEMKKGGSFQP